MKDDVVDILLFLYYWCNNFNFLILVRSNEVRKWSPGPAEKSSRWWACTNWTHGLAQSSGVCPWQPFLYFCWSWERSSSVIQGHQLESCWLDPVCFAITSPRMLSLRKRHLVCHAMSILKRRSISKYKLAKHSLLSTNKVEWVHVFIHFTSQLP